MPCRDECGSIFLQLLVYGLTNGAVVALNAVGFSLAYAVARQINLAHGNVFALAAVLVASLARTFGITAADPPLARIAFVVLLAGCGGLFGAALNAAVERLAFRPFRAARDPLGPLVATVGLSFVLLQIAVWWHAASTVPPPDVHQGVNLPMLAMPDLLPRLELGGGGVSFTLKDAFVLLLGGLAAGGVTAWLARSRAGRLLRASAQDSELATLCGADPDRARVTAFAVAGALAGVGATIFAAYHGGTSAQYGLRSGLAAMMATVLGGVGNPIGALIAGLVLGLFASFSDYLLDAHWTPILVLLLLIGLLTFRPRGLLGGGQVTATEDVPPPASSVAASGRVPRARWVLGGMLVLGLAYPLIDQLAGWQRLNGATTSLLLVALALGLSVVVGQVGLLDLGYAAFFAIGGYTAAILTGSGSRFALGLPEGLREPWLALPLAGLVATGFGLAFGLPGVRARGEYLAIITLAFGEIVPGVIVHLPWWTGGPRGMSGVPPAQLGPWAADSPFHSYVVALGLAALTTLAVTRLAAARTGRAWAAVRDDELAARAVGVGVPRAKLLAFAIGAGVAGLAGAIYAGLQGHVTPEQFDLTLSLMVLAAVVIGGRWGPPGVILGALAITAYDRILLDVLTGGLRALGATLDIPALRATDLRGHNFAVFGLALYLGALLRARAPVWYCRRDRPAAP